MNTTHFNINTDFDGNLPRITLPNPEFYKYLGEEKFRALVNHHYDLLVESSIKDIFPTHERALAAAKKHSADFFIQLMGGPEYYKESRGEPMMRKRHMPFTIDMNARIVWLQCYQIALNELTDVPAHLLQSFWDYLERFSLWMINS